MTCTRINGAIVCETPDFKPGDHGVSPALGIAFCIAATLLYGIAANYSRRKLAGVAPMAQATGFAQGRLPTLVAGRVGPVAVAISDSPRQGALGQVVDALEAAARGGGDLSGPEQELERQLVLAPAPPAALAAGACGELAPDRTRSRSPRWSEPAPRRLGSWSYCWPQREPSCT